MPPLKGPQEVPGSRGVERGRRRKGGRHHPPLLDEVILQGIQELLFVGAEEEQRQNRKEHD